MGRIIASLIIAMCFLSYLNLSLSNDQFMLEEQDISLTSSTINCSNQTHALGEPLHVDNQLGNDSNPGTFDCPLESVSEALNLSSDGDGVGDNSDQFPNDPEEDNDTDGDGIGENSDHDPTIWQTCEYQSQQRVIHPAIYVLAGAIGLLAIALLIGMRRKGGGAVNGEP